MKISDALMNETRATKEELVRGTRNILAASGIWTTEDKLQEIVIKLETGLPVNDLEVAIAREYIKYYDYICWQREQREQKVKDLYRKKVVDTKVEKPKVEERKIEGHRTRRRKEVEESTTNTGIPFITSYWYKGNLCYHLTYENDDGLKFNTSSTRIETLVKKLRSYGGPDLSGYLK